MGQDQGQDQGQGQGQDHLLQQRAALPPFLVLALTLTLVLALVRNIIIFSKVRVLVLNQPITTKNHEIFEEPARSRTPKLVKIRGFSKNPHGAGPQNL